MAKFSDAGPVTPIPGAARKCPICGKPAARRHQPFCSPRCADIDLGRWLKGTYSIPTEEAPEDTPRDEES
jgi:endogenous inhibitor of DNA gyrase (YacG/DUF329 family)